MPTPNRHPQRGNVLVLTMFALIPLLGFLGLAVDLGYMFNYKLRAQIAADAAALAAALTPYNPDLLPDPLAPHLKAAWDIAEANGFKNGEATIVVGVNSPPLGETFMESEPGTYFEAVIKQDIPTYFMSAVGVTSFPIHVRAVAKSSVSHGPCMTVGNATFENSTKLTGKKCDLYFKGDFTSGSGSIEAHSTNKNPEIYPIFVGETKYDPNMPLPDPPGTFPSFSGGSISTCASGQMNPGIYETINISGACKLNSGEYKISKTLKLKGNNNKLIQGEKLIFFLKAGIDAEFDGEVLLKNGAPGYEKFIIWAESGGSIVFQNNAKPNIYGHLYAPNPSLTCPPG